MGGCKGCGFKSVPVGVVRIKVSDLRKALVESLSPHYRNVHFDDESGQLIDRNYGPVRGTEGASSWPRSRLARWLRDNDVETVIDPASGKELPVKRFLSIGRVVPIVRGTRT